MTAQMPLAGWGRYPVVDSTVRRPERFHQLGVNESPLIARGLGRSYGDASLNTHGETLLMERLNRCLEFDHGTGILRAEAGLALAEILDAFVPKGWFVPVTPGTKFATLGGCVACDVHGKNHHQDGTFSKYVREIELLVADGSRRKVTPESDPDLFWATVGGLGLTGIITEVTLQLKKISTAYMRVQHRVAKDLDTVMDLLDTPHKEDQYSVAWIDCLAKGKDLGRSIVMTGHHAADDELPKKVKHPLEIKSRLQLSVPCNCPQFVLNPFTVKAFNGLYYWFEGQKEAPFTVDYDRYFYPLDAVHNWNLIYGKRGFLQYQFVLPSETASEGLRETLAELSKSRRASFLAVLKKFGPQGSGMLSFPHEGYTLALDIANDEGLLPFLDTLDEQVLKHRGRVYLAKDARLSSASLRTMYPRLDEFLAVKKRVDPNNTFSSDLARRLEMVPSAGEDT